MICAWCQAILASLKASKYCSVKCRQAAFRTRRRRGLEAKADRPMLHIFCDPPYVGLSKRYYGKEDSYAGEVDHADLIRRVKERNPDGWALSASVRSLRYLLPLVPEEHRVCSWVKPIGAWTGTRGIHNCWEPLIVVGGRQEKPGKRDWLCAQPARLGGSDLIGRKPIAFTVWMLEMLGAAPGDSLVDLFPGSGNVAAAARALGLNVIPF